MCLYECYKALWSKTLHGESETVSTAEYTSKQPRDPIVPRVPCTGIFLGPSKSGKTVALISAILDQYRTASGESVSWRTKRGKKKSYI